MTNGELKRLQERKRMAYTRRLRSLRRASGLRALDNRERNRLLDYMVRVDGGLEDREICTLYECVLKGM